MAFLDVNDHDEVPKVFAQLSDELARWVCAPGLGCRPRYIRGNPREIPDSVPLVAA